MNEKEKFREIVKKGVEKDISRFDDVKPISDEDMLSSGQELPPADMLEKIKKASSKIAKKGEF